MSVALLGKKVGMTQLFQEDGKCVPVTVLEVGPCRITQIKTEEKEGYNSFQIGFGEKNAKHTSKPLQGHFKKSGEMFMKHLCEVDSINGEYKPGDTITMAIFDPAKKVKVTGMTKGRGFTGVMKRWNFGGGRDSHGCEGHRRPGSIGQCATPNRVFKGMKMGGHYGVEKVSMRNLTIIKTYEDKNIMLVKGSVPGPNDGLVLITQ